MDQAVNRAASTWSRAPWGRPSTSPAAATASTSGPDAAHGAVPVSTDVRPAPTTTTSSTRRDVRVAAGRQEGLTWVSRLPSCAMPVPSVLGLSS